MKKKLGCILALIFVLTQLTSFSYSISETDVSGTEPPLTVSDDPYKKIHVYTSLNDVANYCLLQNKTELDSALCDLKSYASETKRETESVSDIRITVQFASDLAQTEEFLSFRNTIKNATSLSEIREAKEIFPRNTILQFVKTIFLY